MLKLLLDNGNTKLVLLKESNVEITNGCPDISYQNAEKSLE